MEENEVLVERQGTIATITLNRPETLNAISPPMVEAFVLACDELSDDPDIRVIIFTGAGRGFCSGLDLKKNDLSDPKRRSPYRMLNYNEHMIARIRQVAKPTIAAVNGVATGAGLGISLACDLRIASEAARFSAIFARVGMPPQDAVGAFLPQVVGVAKALEMIYTAKMVEASEAKEIGLVSEVVPADKLLDAAMELAGKIAAGPPVALAMAKQVVYRSLGKHIDDQMAIQNLGTFIATSYAPNDLQEALRAFAERRDPQFKGN